MTQKVFEKCCLSMSNRRTIFSGGTLEMNSGSKYNHIQKINFDVFTDRIIILYWDLNNRKIIQEGLKGWIKNGHTALTFPFPIETKYLNRKDVRKINFPLINC